MHFLFQYYFVSKIKISLCTLGWLWTSEPPVSPYWLLNSQTSATIHAIKLKLSSLITVLPTIGKNKIHKHYDCHSIFFHYYRLKSRPFMLARTLLLSYIFHLQFYFVSFVWEQISLCSPSWRGTYYGLPGWPWTHNDSLSSDSRLLELKVYASKSGTIFNFK